MIKYIRPPTLFDSPFETAPKQVLKRLKVRPTCTRIRRLFERGMKRRQSYMAM